MKSTAIATLVLATVLVAAGPVLAGDAAVTGKCVKVVDGDTLIIDCGKETRTVDIDGVDAPELEQPWGKQTRSFVKQLVGGEKVELEVIESAGEAAVTRVVVNGIDLSEMLVSRGLAWVVADSTDTELVELGAKAKRNVVWFVDRSRASGTLGLPQHELVISVGRPPSNRRAGRRSAVRFFWRGKCADGFVTNRGFSSIRARR